MRRRGTCLPFLAFALCSGSNALAWGTQKHHADPDQYVAILNAGDSSLEDLVDRESRTLAGIHLGRLIAIESPGLHAGVRAELTRLSPQTVETAMAASGQRRADALTALQQSFERAVCNSAYVQAIDAVLRRQGYRVADVSTEKFMTVELRDEEYFDAIVWLRVKKRSAIDGDPESPVRPNSVCP